MDDFHERWATALSPDWDKCIDEAALSRTDRLGLAYCRLNCYQWDDLVGPKPEGFDDLPENLTFAQRLHDRSARCQSDFVRPALLGIESIIGEAATSRCWWKFRLGRSEEEWFAWYVTQRFNEFRGTSICGLNSMLSFLSFVTQRSAERRQG